GRQPLLKVFQIQLFILDSPPRHLLLSLSLHIPLSLSLSPSLFLSLSHSLCSELVHLFYPPHSFFFIVHPSTLHSPSPVCPPTFSSSLWSRCLAPSCSPLLSSPPPLLSF